MGSDPLVGRRVISSPIAYLGGKRRAGHLILPLLPPETQLVISPFGGGCALELAWASHGRTVRAFDAFAPLVNFYQRAMTETDDLAECSEQLLSMTAEDPGRLFAKLKGRIRMGKGDLAEAACFYACSKASFLAAVLSASRRNRGRLTKRCVQSLRAFGRSARGVDFQVEKRDFREVLAANTEDHWMYLDPPYRFEDRSNERYYGDNGALHRNFDHLALRVCLGGRRNWFMSYGDVPEIRQLYVGHHIATLSRRRSVTGRLSSEILIAGAGVRIS